MAGEDDGAAIGEERLGERVDCFHVEMVARLVEDENVERAEQEACEAEPGPFATGEHRHTLFDRLAAEEHRPGEIEDSLRLRADRRRPLQVRQHRVVFVEARVDVLGVDAEFAAMAPLHLAGQWHERPHERPQKRRLALAVVADNGGPRAVHDLDVDRLRYLPIGIADRQPPAPHRRPLPRRHLRAADRRGRGVSREFFHLELLKLLAL